MAIAAGAALAEMMEESAGAVVFWVLVLVGLLVGAYVAIALLRRRLGSEDELAAPGFTLGDLRDLKRSGKISEEEFKRAHESLSAQLREQFHQHEKEGPKKETPH